MDCWLARPVHSGIRALCFVATTAAATSGTVLATGLNDTGQTGCYDANGNPEACVAGAQDGRSGRDAAATIGVLPKTGGGDAGFDFTKIANNGSALAASADLGPNPTDWACTRDNVTGLTWEVKTADVNDLRYYTHSYTWYSTAANNGGNSGDVGSDTCNGTLAAYANQCNTTNYLLAVNAAALCGYSDWRLPSRTELHGIKSFGPGDPAIDATYFPNTLSYLYWTAETYAAVTDYAWVIKFEGDVYGNTSTNSAPKNTFLFIRVVRGP